MEYVGICDDGDGNCDELIVKRKKKCRRSKVNRNKNKEIIVMYANVQGVRGKITSLQHVMSTTGADIVLLTETMTRNVSVEGCVSVSTQRYLWDKMCRYYSQVDVATGKR